jgi:hypothetical protein
MIAATYILLALGILGATDILLYHSISHGIRSHKDSRWELLTHSMRGPTYAALFLIIPNFETRGAWAIVIALLLGIDVGISIADFALERKSRANLGGLPSGEYVLHMIMAMLFGAFVTMLMPHLLRWIQAETALIPSSDFARAWMRLTLAAFAIGVLASGFLDAIAALRLSQKMHVGPT